MELMISISATSTKSLRGATKLIAKKAIKIKDDEHDAAVKVGDEFYVKKHGDNHYFVDKDGKDLYQFAIDEKRYNQLLKDHTAPEVKARAQKRDDHEKRKNAMGGYIEKHFDEITQHPEYTKALKAGTMDAFLRRHNPDYAALYKKYIRSSSPGTTLNRMDEIKNYYIKNAKFAGKVKPAPDKMTNTERRMAMLKGIKEDGYYKQDDGWVHVFDEHLTMSESDFANLKKKLEDNKGQFTFRIPGGEDIDIITSDSPLFVPNARSGIRIKDKPINKLLGVTEIIKTQYSR